MLPVNNETESMPKKVGVLKKLARYVYQKGMHGFGLYLDKMATKHEIPDEALVGDGDWAVIEEDGYRVRLIIRIMAVSILILVVWAAFAKIDEVTRGEGKVVPSSEIQILQSLDGGNVSAISVKEGQQVKKGQLLLKIDPIRFASSLKENQAQYYSLVARVARLQALSDNKPFVAPEEVIKNIPQVAEQERALYESSMQGLEANVAIARQQLVQRNQELVEVKSRRDQAAQNYELAAKELAVTKPLAQSGAVSDVELLRLERDVSRSKGDRDQAAAQIPRLQAAIQEATRKIQEVELAFRNQIRGELSESVAKLNSLSAGSEGLADRVKQTEIRSPVNGTVKRLNVNTLGGVVQPGKDIIEIVPSEDALLLEAKILPKDIAFLRPGQSALIKFTAYDFSIYGGLEATLEQIGADTVTDEKGNAFYIIRLRTAQSYIGDNHMPIIPGMVAEVDVRTGKKTVLSYLLKPVLKAKSNALSER